MARFIKGIVSLFTGNAGADAQAAAQKQENLTRISQDNQRAALQAEQQDLTQKRAPRGRRLLIAKEGSERGLSNTLGG